MFPGKGWYYFVFLRHVRKKGLQEIFGDAVCSAVSFRGSFLAKFP